MYGRTCGCTEIPVEASRCVSRDKSCQAENDERGVGLGLHLSEFSEIGEFPLDVVRLVFFCFFFIDSMCWV